ESRLMPPASAFAVVAVGAVLGAWLRWLLVAKFNAAVPNLPLGTLIANVSGGFGTAALDRKSTRLNSSHVETSYAVFCLKKNKAARRSASVSAAVPPCLTVFAMSRVVGLVEPAPNRSGNTGMDPAFGKTR